MKNKKVKSLEHLITLIMQGNYYYSISLKGNLKSSKYISWHESKNCFEVINGIDNTRQNLNLKQLMDKSYTNIGYAITKGALLLNN